MAKVILRDELASLWTEENAFEKVREIEGVVAKAKDNRRVVRFDLNGQAYYLKHHVGVGWKEIFKNYLQMKAPVLGASNEWYAIEKLKGLGINTMQAVGFGESGINPADIESFLITRELTDTLSLEKICEQWKTCPPAYALKKSLIEQVAAIARRLHEGGLNHRDFYLCHILLDIKSGIENIDPKNLTLYLVDLHRVQVRKQVPRRWLVKDIGSIYFSALDLGLSKRDAIRFLREYTGTSARAALESPFWGEVNERACQLYRRDFGKEPSLLL